MFLMSFVFPGCMSAEALDSGFEGVALQWALQICGEVYFWIIVVYSGLSIAMHFKASV